MRPAVRRVRAHVYRCIRRHKCAARFPQPSCGAARASTAQSLPQNEIAKPPHLLAMSECDEFLRDRPFDALDGSGDIPREDEDASDEIWAPRLLVDRARQFPERMAA